MNPRRADVFPTLLRGLRKRCPRCGRGRLFCRWYTLSDRCGTCGLEHQLADGNTWAFMYISTAALTGTIVLGMFLFAPPSLALGRAVVFPAVLLLIGGSLPYRKGVAIAIEYLVEQRWHHGEDE